VEKILIKNGLVARGSGALQEDILIEEGVIRQLGVDLPAQGAKVKDASGLIVLPGGVDVHVHLPWPTGSHVSTDTFATGTRAAAFGGVTSVIDFCIPEGEESLSEVLYRKKDEAAREAWVDYSFHLNIRGEIQEKVKEIPALMHAGFPSFKVFMAYEGFRLDDPELRLVLEAARSAGALVTVHAEDGLLADRLTKKLLVEGRKSLNYYPESRPVECEEDAIHRLLHYQQQIGTRVHIHHVSTSGGVRAIAEAKLAGRPVSGETCPHYLLFTSGDYCGDPARAASLVCSPSIKGVNHQKSLWEGLENGTLSIIATDHCPYTCSQKEADLTDFSKVPGGMGGVELRLPLIYSAGVATGKMTLERFVQVWAEEPARIFGLSPRKGRLVPGVDADLVLFDPSTRWEVHAAELHMNTDCLPYEGMRLQGKVQATFLRGRLICREDELQAEPGGTLIPRVLPR
jgi:dihydropyrimidinase